METTISSRCRPERTGSTLSKQGFATLHRDGIVIRVGDQISLDLELRVGDVSQSVEVTAAAPLLQSSRGTASFVVEQKKMVSLPLDGRNFVPLIALSPGVNLPPGNLLPRINGSRPRTSEYIYDGISVLQPEPGQVAFYPIVDAIEEFRVETNSPSAEYGRSNGGVIMVNQKYGSNDLHGTLFEFFRNEALNARNLFATTGAKAALSPQSVRVHSGWSDSEEQDVLLCRLAGNAARHRRCAHEHGSHQRTETRRVHATDLRSANHSSNRVRVTCAIRSPATRFRPQCFDPATRAVMDRYPAPNVFSGANEATANNYRRVGSDTTAQDQFDVRLDRYFGARHKIFGRYSYLRDDSDPATPLPDGSGTFTATFIGKTLTRADSVVGEHTWNLDADHCQPATVRFHAQRIRSLLAGDRAACDSSLADPQYSAHLLQ